MTSLEFRNNPMFLRNHFKGDGTFEMPKIKKEEVDLENIELTGYDKLSSSKDNHIVHFFLDDYKFEVMWNDPLPRIEKLKSHKAVLSPNFSIYSEMPVPMKIYNTFRSRWCGAYLQQNGIKVIPTIAWGGPETFWFCFDGIETKSVVAVSTLGVRNEKDLFMQGYNEMLRRIKPTKIICYGEPFSEMKGDIIEVDYAKTNNLGKSFDSSGGYIKRSVGYVVPYVEKGMGSAGGGGKITWKPKKPEDERFIGRPGEIKETFNSRGEKVLTKISKNGFAEKERHCGDHDRPKYHTNPHDHFIDWSNNFPDFHSQTNYHDNIPEFKMFGGFVMKSDKNIIEYSKYESVDDFIKSIKYGKEVGICYKGVDYGIFLIDGIYYFGESKHEETEVSFSSVEDLLEIDIQGARLKDIITEVELWLRNV